MAQRRIRGVLKVNRREPSGVLDRAKLMEKGLTDHTATFPSPNPPLPVFRDQIVTTDEAQVAVANGGKGVAAARDVQLGLLVGMMTSELLYLQSIADAGSPDQAISTLLSGGVLIAGVGRHEQSVLTVTPGPTATYAPAGGVLRGGVGTARCQTAGKPCGGRLG